MQDVVHDVLLWKRYVQDAESCYGDITVRTRRKHCSHVFEGIELVRVSEQHLGTDEEMNEMAVRVPDEAFYIIIGMNFHMAEHIVKDVSECHAAQIVGVYYCETRCHNMQI